MADRAAELQLLTVREVAEALRVSVRTVWNLRASGALPSHSPSPGIVRFHLDDVFALVGRQPERFGSDVERALASFGESIRAAPNLLCPRCGRRERRGSDFCAVCEGEVRDQRETSHELEKARKRRMWAKKGDEYRARQKAKREAQERDE